MKDKGKLNLIIDQLMLLVLALMAGIGFLMKFVLPPGRERVAKYGANTELYFLGADRHQWGDIHLITAYVMIALTLLHIVFHWDAIICLFRKLVPAARLRWSLMGVLALLSLFLLLSPFLISPVQKKGGDALHDNSHVAQGQVDLNGRMSLGEVAKQFGISVPEAKKRLNLPAHVTETETLGHLRKEYGFTMEEARELLRQAGKVSGS